MEKSKKGRGTPSPKYWIGHIRLLGLKVRKGCGVISEMPIKLVPGNSVPPPESTDEVVKSGLLRKLAPTATLFSDGARAWPAAVKKLKLKVNHYHVKHNKHEFVKKIKRLSKPRVIVAGTQAIDRYWQSIDEFVPRQINNKLGKGSGTNPKLLQYVYAYVWRSTLSQTVDMKKALGQISNI